MVQLVAPCGEQYLAQLSQSGIPWSDWLFAYCKHYNDQSSPLSAKAATVCSSSQVLDTKTPNRSSKIALFSSPRQAKACAPRANRGIPCSQLHCVGVAVQTAALSYKAAERNTATATVHKCEKLRTRSVVDWHSLHKPQACDHASRRICRRTHVAQSSQHEMR